MSGLRNCLSREVLAAAGSAAFALALIAPATARAQAYVPPKGDGAVAILYQHQYVEKHSLDDGKNIDRGATRTHIAAVDVTYGLTNRVALNLSLPYIASAYLGTYPHLAAQFGRDSALDVGGYHGTFQDFRLDLRFNAVNRGNGVVTPVVSMVIPSHSYDYFGHGAAGRRMVELQAGAFVGRSLDRLLPGTFVQARYVFGVPQSLMGVRAVRSLMDAEVAYFVRPTLRVFGVATGIVGHSGVRFTALNFFDYLTRDGRIHHDRISRITAFNFGGGAQLSVSPTVDVFGSIMHTASMTNGHVLKYGLTGGVSWSFHRGPKKTATVASQRSALAKCLCQKGQ